MSLTARIQQIVSEKFDPLHFEIINESDHHIGHAGHDGSGESHFKLIVVSKSFDGHNRVQRSRQMYAALNPLFSEGLHALSLDLRTPDEQENKK